MSDENHNKYLRWDGMEIKIGNHTWCRNVNANENIREKGQSNKESNGTEYALGILLSRDKMMDSLTKKTFVSVCRYLY